MPLLGQQPNLASHMKEIATKWLPSERPKSIVVFSAHWESDPIQISSSAKPSMYYDYYGFPSESYTYQYPAPGEPALAQKIQNLLTSNGLKSELNGKRGFDHGVFVPLMLMFPDADIPVVSVSLHGSLDAVTNIRIGEALAPLRDEGILLLGSGYSFHNLPAFFNPSQETYEASIQFNDWLKDTLLHSGSNAKAIEKLQNWSKAPGGRVCHPREEHLLPLLMAAAAGGPDANAELIFDVSPTKGTSSEHAVSGYLFR